MQLIYSSPGLLISQHKYRYRQHRRHFYGITMSVANTYEKIHFWPKWQY